MLLFGGSNGGPPNINVYARMCAHDFVQIGGVAYLIRIINVMVFFKLHRIIMLARPWRMKRIISFAE